MGLLKRFLSTFVVLLCSLSLLPSQELLSSERAEILKLVTQLERNLQIRKQKIENLQSRLAILQNNQDEILLQLDSLERINEDLLKQIKDFENSAKIRENSLTELERIVTNWQESNQRMKTQLENLESYYRKKIVKVGFFAGLAGLLIGFISGIIINIKTR